MNADDTRATSRLLDRMEAHLLLEEVVELLEAIAGEAPALPALPFVACV